MLEQVLMRIQTLKVDTARTLDMHFKVKLQLEEQLEDNEVKLHFCRGVLGGCDEIEKFIQESSGDVSIIPSIKSAMDGLAMDKKDVKFPDTGVNVEGIIGEIEAAQKEGGK